MACLLVFGRRDGSLPVDAMYRSLPHLQRADVRLVEDAGRHVHMEKPQEVNSAIREFIGGERRVRGRRQRGMWLVFWCLAETGVMERSASRFRELFEADALHAEVSTKASSGDASLIRDFGYRSVCARKATALYEPSEERLRLTCPI